MTNTKKLLDNFIRDKKDKYDPKTLRAFDKEVSRFVDWITKVQPNFKIIHWDKRTTSRYLKSLLNDKKAHATINRTLSLLKTFGGNLFDRGVLNQDPCRGIRQLKVTKKKSLVTKNDLIKTLRLAQEVPKKEKTKISQALRNRVFLELMLSTPLRGSDLLGLTLEQFNESKNILVNVKRVRHKTCTRILPLPKECASLLSEYIKTSRTQGSNFLFTNRYGEKISDTSMRKALRTINKDLGDKLSPRSIRVRLKPSEFKTVEPLETQERVIKVDRDSIYMYSVIKQKRRSNVSRLS
jgi:integrase/recombinase XerD